MKWSLSFGPGTWRNKQARKSERRERKKKRSGNETTANNEWLNAYLFALNWPEQTHCCWQALNGRRNKNWKKRTMEVCGKMVNRARREITHLRGEWKAATATVTVKEQWTHFAPFWKGTRVSDDQWSCTTNWQILCVATTWTRHSIQNEAKRNETRQWEFPSVESTTKKKNPFKNQERRYGRDRMWQRKRLMWIFFFFLFCFISRVQNGSLGAFVAHCWIYCYDFGAGIFVHKTNA